MDLHWWCCECDGTNSSPDDDHLVCSHEGCDHHLCSDCYNPQELGRDRHLNYNQAPITTTKTTISRAIVNDSRYDENRMKKKRFKNARRLIGHHLKHSRIGRSLLNFWSYVLRKTGRKKEKLRIDGNKAPAVAAASNTLVPLAFTSYYYQPEGTSHYAEEKYYYQR